MDTKANAALIPSIGKVDDWVSAPADDCHDLGNLDLAPDLSVRLLGCCCCEADQELIVNVAEESH